MRILSAVTLIDPDGAYGGPLRVALNQAAALRDRSHSVTLAAATRGYDVAPTELDGTPLVLRKAFRVAPKTGFAGLSAPTLVAWLNRSRNQFDVAHLHFARDLVLVPLAALVRRLGLPFVLQPHGMVQPRSNPLAPIFDTVAVRRLLCDADQVLYLTEEERDQIDEVARGGAKLTQLPNGVPLYEPAGHQGEVPEALFLARLHPRKRAMDFISAATDLNNRGVQARYALVGPDEGDGERVSAACATTSNVRWEGALRAGEGPHRMRRSSVYVLPSVNEPFPMAVLEAMSVGLPVIVTTECGLAPTVRKHDCGIVVEPGARNIADAMAELLTSPEMVTDMGSRARKAVENELGMASVGETLEKIYCAARGV